MNCFVIMPFSREYDDVYGAIKSSVEGALSTNGGRCFRLDETRPAGRITDRLLTELQASFMCIADLTGNKPNVMWEVGYAMALGKPIIIITQNIQELPFDLKDMQSLEYDRHHLNETLSRPLHHMVIDTVSAPHISQMTRELGLNANNELVAELRTQVAELKSIVGQAVRLWNPSQLQVAETKDESRNLMNLEGAWFNKKTRSHMYTAMINDDLVGAYCYGGNDYIVGVYYGWRTVGEHWFARFTWLSGEFSGFSFLKQESLDLLTGAWWFDEEGMQPPTMLPDTSGVQSVWERKPTVEYPTWASQFIADIRREGLIYYLTRR